jgi:hypothetical protein
MTMLSDEQKFKVLSQLIKKNISRDMKGEEESFLNWLVCWDMDTFNTFRGMLEDIKR